MGRVDKAFTQRVYDLVATIPSGRVMTYGQIATLCGFASAAWEVGQIAHSGPTELPWQRVVNKQGGMASGWPGGPELQQNLLEAEGVNFTADGRISNLNVILWQPKQISLF